MSRNWKKKENVCSRCERWREKPEDEVCRECPYMLDPSDDFFGDGVSQERRKDEAIFVM